MDSPVKHFTAACGDYADCVELLKAVFKVAKKNAEELAEEMDENAFLAKFDVSLQAFLLKIAVADGEPSAEELLFIGTLTDFGDLLLPLDIEWKDLADISKEQACSLADSALEAFKGEFLLTVAFVDKLTGKDVYSVLKERMLGITIDLAKADSDFRKEELMCAAKGFIETFDSEYRAHYEDFDE